MQLNMASNRQRRVLGWAALLMICAAAPGWARHHARAQESSPGVFDYYVLSLSWSPAFCLQSPDAAECNGPRRFGFIAHGLWPQFERGWPEHCAAGGDVPDSVAQEISDLMPARKLVFHEWSTHGTCSGLDPADYFATVRRAFISVAIPKPLTGPTEAVSRSPQEVVAEFLKANPQFTPQSLAVMCTGQGAPRIREVHVCLSRELQPRACSEQVLRAACKAPSMIIPPIR